MDINQKKLIATVIIPFYNGKEFVFEALESLCNQTRLPDEIIIVDDGTTDEKSLAVLEKIENVYKDVKIIHQQNKGISGAMNAGAKIASGDIIFQLDCDDILHEQYIQKYMHVFENDENIDAVTCQYASFFDGKDYRKLENIHHIYKPKGIILPDLFFENCAGGADSAYKKKVLEKINYWDERFKSYQDWGMWLKFVEYNLKQCIIPEVLYYYRVHEHSDLRMRASDSDLEKNLAISMRKIISNNEQEFENVFYSQMREIYQTASKVKNMELQIKKMKSSHFWKMRHMYMKLMKKHETK